MTSEDDRNAKGPRDATRERKLPAQQRDGIVRYVHLDAIQTRTLFWKLKPTAKVELVPSSIMWRRKFAPAKLFSRKLHCAFLDHHIHELVHDLSS